MQKFWLNKEHKFWTELSKQQFLCPEGHFCWKKLKKRCALMKFFGRWKKVFDRVVKFVLYVTRGIFFEKCFKQVFQYRKILGHRMKKFQTKSTNFRRNLQNSISRVQGDILGKKFKKGMPFHETFWALSKVIQSKCKNCVPNIHKNNWRKLSELNCWIQQVFRHEKEKFGAERTNFCSNCLNSI